MRSVATGGGGEFDLLWPRWTVSWADWRRLQSVRVAACPGEQTRPVLVPARVRVHSAESRTECARTMALQADGVAKERKSILRIQDE